MIDHIRGIEGVMVAAFFEELTDGRVRLSLRSKDPGSTRAHSAHGSAAGDTKWPPGARLPGPLDRGRRASSVRNS